MYHMIKHASAQKLALIAASALGVFFLAMCLMMHLWLDIHLPGYVYPAGALLLFGFAYGLFYFILTRFIYDRIRLIYKTIHDLKAPSGQRKETLYSSDSDSDMIAQASEEVAAWASDQQKQIADLRKMESYRREFLGNVSHELKTPIFNIQGYVLTLLDGGLEDPRINRSYLERAEKSINRMISIVEDLETISRLESAELKLKYSHFDIVTLAREVVEALEMDAKAQDISIVFGRDYDPSVMVYADRQNIQQVLTNLIVNAIKYGKENGRIKLSFFDMDKNILTEVTDDGIGIEREEIPRVFERFYRGEKSRSRNHGGGSGLGLAIVKHIIEAHKQTINVRSTPGVGTTFAFTLKKGKSVTPMMLF